LAPDCAISAALLRMADSCVRRSCSFSILLAQPAHPGAEEKEHREAHRNRDQRALGLVDDHLVDHHLGPQRRGEPDQLNEERSEEHVAPDALVPQELGPEPAETELRSRRCAVGRVNVRGGLMANEEDAALEMILERCDRRGLRRLGPGYEIEQPLGVPLREERRLRVLPRQKPHAGIRRLGDPAFARPEAERAQRFDQLPKGMRCGKLLEKKRGIERHAVDLAQAADQPRKVAFGYRSVRRDQAASLWRRFL
jgi:hypothetical protein